MPKLRIDQQEVEVPEGTTVIQAAKKAGIDIPAMCYQEGIPFFTSCMVCVVKDLHSGRMLPACSAQATEGMEIQTESEIVREARKDTLELLLSEHVGNCEGPCRQACPADTNIPWVNSQIEQGNSADAIAHLNHTLIFPSLVERCCAAPCEQVCRRGAHDSPVAIRQLALHLADQEMNQGFPSLPTPAPANGTSVAIVGAGPTGLATAYCLLLKGYACTIYDAHNERGGDVTKHIPEDRLPRPVIDAEFGKLDTLGATFVFNTRVGSGENEISIEHLLTRHDVLVLTIGKVKPETPHAFALCPGPFGIGVDDGTHQTSNKKVFSGGDAIRPFRSVARSIADGRRIARSVDQYLKKEPFAPKLPRFNSRVGRLQEDELAHFVEGYNRADQIVPANGTYGPNEAKQEAERCLHCECLKPDTCKLRIYSERYGAVQDAYLQRIRRKYERVLQHAEVLFEPGKCIKCGLCIRIAEQHREPLGLTFINRGFDLRIAVPLDESMADGLSTVAQQVVKACPTAALSFKSHHHQKMQEQPHD